MPLRGTSTLVRSHVFLSFSCHNEKWWKAFGKYHTGNICTFGFMFSCFRPCVILFENKILYLSSSLFIFTFCWSIDEMWSIWNKTASKLTGRTAHFHHKTCFIQSGSTITYQCSSNQIASSFSFSVHTNFGLYLRITMQILSSLYEILSTARQLMAENILEEKSNPGGYGSLTAVLRFVLLAKALLYFSKFKEIQQKNGGPHLHLAIITILRQRAISNEKKILCLSCIHICVFSCSVIK